MAAAPDSRKAPGEAVHLRVAAVGALAPSNQVAGLPALNKRLDGAAVLVGVLQPTKLLPVLLLLPLLPLLQLPGDGEAARRILLEVHGEVHNRRSLIQIVRASCRERVCQYV